MPGPDPLIYPTLMCFLNGAAVCLVFVLLPRVRRHPLFQLLSAAYILASIGLYTSFIPEDRPYSTLANYWLYLVAVLGYLPVIAYLGSAALEVGLTVLLSRVIPDRSSRRMIRWRKRLLRASPGRDRRLLQRKLRELKRDATDPVVRRELIELHLSQGDVDSALYQCYALVELLPYGHAHAFALYRLAQILVDHQGMLEAAQPYLRRIIRGYPRSFFASYARRLVNQYEAYADREL